LYHLSLLDTDNTSYHLSLLDTDNTLYHVSLLDTGNTLHHLSLLDTDNTLYHLSLQFGIEILRSRRLLAVVAVMKKQMTMQNGQMLNAKKRG